MNADRYGSRGNAPESSLTYSDLNREDAARERRIDAATALPSVGSLTEKWDHVKLAREAKDLLTRCRIAAAMVAGNASQDEKDDVSAVLASRYLDNLGRPMPVTLSTLCGEARNIYRKVNARKDREADNELALAAIEAGTPTATGTDPEQIAEKIERATMAADDAATLATQLAKRLGIKGAAMPDSAVWTAIYRWLRNADAVTCSAERVNAQLRAQGIATNNVTAAALERQANRGGEIIRASFTVDRLLAVLLDGIGIAPRTGPKAVCEQCGSANCEHDGGELPPVTASRQLVGCDALLYGGDGTRPAHHHTSLMKADDRRVEGGEVAESAPVGPLDHIDGLNLRPRLTRTRTPEERRAAHSWNRSEYRARMASVGQGADDGGSFRATTAEPTVHDSDLVAA